MSLKVTRTLLVLCVVLVLLTACGKPTPPPPPTMYDVLKEESNKIAAQQKTLMTNQPAPTVTYSNERANLIRRAEIFNDPNKISWIYIFDSGACVGFYSVKGKVSNKSSYLVPDDQVVYGNVVQAPDIDGSYGTNGEGIFWFTADGQYKETNLKYFVSEDPVKLTIAPIMMEMKVGGQ